MFQQRHFEFIAKTLARMLEGDVSRITYHKVVVQFADELATTNPRFNRAKFLKACGVEQ